MEIFLLILAAIGLGFIFQKILRPLLNHLLNGPFNEYYLEYLNGNARFQFDTATNEQNPDRAWDEVIFKKVEELSSRKVPYSRREANLKYIKASGRVSKKLIDELIRALPNQSRNLEFQNKLTRFIVELQDKLRERGNGNNEHAHASVPPSINDFVIDRWTSAFATWLSGAVYFIASMIFWDRYSATFILLINFGLFLVMLFPLVRLVWSHLAKAASIATLATLLLGGMGIFAQTAHAERDRLVLDLTDYKLPNTVLTIDYPNWLTMSHLEECQASNIISLTIDGEIPDPMALVFDTSLIMTKDDRCHEVLPRFNEPPQPNQIVTFFLAPRDRDVLRSQTVTITPRIMKSSTQPPGLVENIDISHPSIQITLESWIWGLIANAGVQLGSLGTTVALFLTKILIGLKR